MSGVNRRVLLTGANGFIGSHILSQLLDAGFYVRSVVRSQEKAAGLRKSWPNASKNLDFAIVEDITAPSAFDAALQTEPAVDTVIHTASPFFFGVANSSRDFLDPAIKGTLELLKSTKKLAPAVARVIITSSFAAVSNMDQIANAGKTFTNADWNPMTWEVAVNTKNYRIAYRASKKFAEKAAWDFMAQEKPPFDLVTLNPPMVYGPLRHVISSISELNESNARVWRLFFNTERDAAMPPNDLHLYIDVRDLARAHVSAALTPDATNKRFIVCGGSVSSQEIADLLRSHLPEVAERTPIGEPGANTLPPAAFTADSEPAREILGFTVQSKESTFIDMGRQVLKIERAEKSQKGKKTYT